MSIVDKLQEIKEKVSKGDAEACYELAEYYYAQKDYKNAFQMYQKTITCVDANPTAYFNIAYAYQFGEGVERDLSAAFDFYSQAAGYNLPQAMYNLAYFYENGFVVSQDYSRAEEYCRRATFELNRLTTQLYHKEQKEKKEKSIYENVQEQLSGIRVHMDSQDEFLETYGQLSLSYRTISESMKDIQDENKSLQQKYVDASKENARLGEQCIQTAHMIDDLKKDKLDLNRTTSKLIANIERIKEENTKLQKENRKQQEEKGEIQSSFDQYRMAKEAQTDEVERILEQKTYEIRNLSKKKKSCTRTIVIETILLVVLIIALLL